jgi:hypothetical protein
MVVVPKWAWVLIGVYAACGGTSIRDPGPSPEAGGSGSGGSGGHVTDVGDARTEGSAASSSGASSADGSAGGAPLGCKSDSDCVLEDDCCWCRGIGAAETIPPCSIRCTQTQCRGAVANVQCAGGRCIAGFDCDGSKVICPAAPPRCNSDLEHVTVRDGCWGPCVPRLECAPQD